jgi:transposase
MLVFIDLEKRVPMGHPLQTIEALADQALTALFPKFDAMYAEIARPSIPPELQLKASLLIARYWVRSERFFCEQLESSFEPTEFTKNCERLLKHWVAQVLFAEVVAEAYRRRLLSDQHFTVDGSLSEAGAS